MSLKMRLEEKGIESSSLDDLVHDAASKAASDANNGGLESQLTFLTDTLDWTEEDIISMLEHDGVL